MGVTNRACRLVDLQCVLLWALHALCPRSETTLLLRLGHQFAVGEDPVLSHPATVDVQALLPSLSITSLTEMSLTANQVAASMKPLQVPCEIVDSFVMICRVLCMFFPRDGSDWTECCVLALCTLLVGLASLSQWRTCGESLSPPYHASDRGAQSTDGFVVTLAAMEIKTFFVTATRV